MSNRAFALALVACVAAGGAAAILITLSDRVEEPPLVGLSDAPRLMVRETTVPESERKPSGPIRIYTLEYVRGPASSVVARYEAYTREVDPAMRLSGRKELELLDSLLAPRRGVVLYQQNLMLYAGVFDPEVGRPARVCRLTSCGATNEVASARLVEDAQGFRAEIVRESDHRTDVYELTIGHDEIQCRKRPNAD